MVRNYQWTPEILLNKLLEAGCTNKLCPFQYYVKCEWPVPIATTGSVIVRRDRVSSTNYYDKQAS